MKKTDEVAMRALQRRKQLAAMSEEQREAYHAAARKRVKAWRANMSEEQSEAIRAAKRIENMSDEEIEIRKGRWSSKSAEERRAIGRRNTAAAHESLPLATLSARVSVPYEVLKKYPELAETVRALLRTKRVIRAKKKELKQAT